MIEDEGQTRAEAVAWVLAFEPATEPHRSDARVTLGGDLALDGEGSLLGLPVGYTPWRPAREEVPR